MSNLRVSTLESLGSGDVFELDKLGYTFEYAAGVTVSSNSQIIKDGGLLYRASGSTPLPYTTTGAGMPESGAFTVVDVDVSLRQDLADGSADIAGETAGDIAAAINAINKSDIRLFGAPSLDVGDLIQAALNATGAAYVPAGSWTHTGSVVTLSDDQHVFFAGSKIIKVSGANGAFIVASGRKNWSVTGAATYFGTRTSALDVGNEKFLQVDGGRAYRVSGLTAYNCRSHGFHFRDGPHGGGVHGERGQISNIAAYECDIGIETAANATAEYNVFSNVNTCNNRIGIKDGAGNTIFTGGNCTTNEEIGFWLVGNYGNNAHGIISSMNINHNGIYNLQCDDVAHGHTFDNNHFYGNALDSGFSTIFLNNSKGIVISGGVIDCWIYNYDGVDSGKNYIKGVYMPGDYGDVATVDGLGLRPKDLIVLDCHGEGAYQVGVAISDPSECYVLAQRTPGYTQDLTSGEVTDLVFPYTEQNGDRRRAYNEGNGTFTVPDGQNGQYAISATLVFQGTELNAIASFAELIVPGGKRLITLSAGDDILLTGSVTTDIYLNAGATVNVKAKIVGTSPVFGSSGYASSLQITRIS